MKKDNKENYSVGIHDVLRIIRIANDLSANELAQRLDVTPSYISQIENGHRVPNMSLLKRYSELFGIPVSAIIRAEEKHTAAASLNEKFSAKMFRIMKVIEEWGGLSAQGSTE